MTRYEHLTVISEATGEDVPELDGPDVPGIVSHVFEWFMELHASRQQGPISYSEIRAWSGLTGRQPSPFEIDLIKRLDLTYLEQQNDRRSRASDKS